MNQVQSYLHYDSLLTETTDHIESIYKAEGSLHEFTKQAWPYAVGNEEFVDGWHIEAICEHLEALSRREIRNLLINVPPRSTKSYLISVMFPAWMWVNDPHEQFLYVSYANALSLRDSVRCRRLILSDWYQRRWGSIYSLVGDQNTKGRFDNSMMGYRIASSVNSTITGEGGSIIVCFPYDVSVVTDKGELPIGQIVEEEIQCRVLSFNEFDGAPQYKAIEAYEKNPGQELVEIELDDRTIECTLDHPIYVQGYGYIQAKDVHPGHVVFCI